MINITKDDNIQYYIEYNAETYFPGCAGCGYYDDGGCVDYCRCESIESVRVNRFYNWLRFNHFNYVSGTTVEKALDVWFLQKLNKKFDLENYFTFEKEPGYYGEELMGIYATDALIEVFNKFNTLPLIEKLYFVLDLEYGRILPILKNINNLECKIVYMNKVVPTSNMKQMDAQLVSNLTRRLGQRSSADSILPTLCVDNGNGKYKLIDGRHRYQAHKQVNKRKINIMLLS